MPGNDVTLALEGEVTLEDFAATLTNFTQLMDELSKFVAQSADIVWVIDELHAGSAEVTAIGVSEQTEAVTRAVRAYEVIAESLETGQSIPYPSNVTDKAVAITRVINGRISAVRFQTSEVDRVVSTAFTGQARKSNISAFGMVKGQVETLNRRRGLKFTLYDDVLDKPIICHIRPDQEELVREIWGKRVMVTGIIEREPEKGHARSVKEVTDISLVIEVDPESYKVARGVIPWYEGDEPPEVSVRRMRDAN